MRNTQAIVGAEGRKCSRMAGDSITAPFRITFQVDDEASRTRVKRWERHDIGTLPVG